MIGWVTSGGYGHSVKQSLAQGYIPATLAETTDSNFFAIEILGQRFAANLITEPLFDPTGSKMRS